MFFASDNWAGAHPDIVQSLVQHASGFAQAYGTSDLDRRVEARFAEIFERDCQVFFVGTGTAANALSLTAFNKAGGVTFCHREAHVIEDECGAPEFFLGGSRLHGVDGPAGKMTADTLQKAIARFPEGFVHSGRPMGVTVTQATEIGTLYSLAELDAISAVCRQHDLPLHMDGARFANALATLHVSPAEMTWKRGVDVVSFGGTKNGCWCAEAIIIFGDRFTGELPYIRKRGAQLFSKTRFIAAQFDAYLRDDLWLQTARHANAMARQLADILAQSPGGRLGWQPEANEVFAVLSPTVAERLQAAGAVFYPWKLPRTSDITLQEGEQLYRFVTSFATTSSDLDQVSRLLRN
ncbi:threonine aldolase family protein [Tianweitania sediminis]|uniref:L-threonine aldolase n=1 Tax=Tianweitania sediminis TaxID=1502156 RepID=A0A8J7UJX9_9HYPH|nr:low specificity L-threonine aldolase [Tianweitania sediminis]MBP0439305.1 low specificity L-threonine aldolase [Tianweitania sediminis]